MKRGINEWWHRSLRSLRLIRQTDAPEVIVLRPPADTDESMTMRELSMRQHPAGRGGRPRTLTGRTRGPR
jgi:hypothetical protein